MEIVTDIKRLRKPTNLVEEGDDINLCVEELFKGLKEYNALGLSANQLGYNYSIFVMIMPTGPPICLVNPILTKKRGSELRDEACLSIPKVIVKVKRPRQIVIKGRNRYFKPVRYKFNGLQARIACHEGDHLFGKLIIDYKEEE